MRPEYDTVVTTQIIENSVGELFRGIFRLNENKEYQEAYDVMGAVINMLVESRQHLRETQTINF